jgi:hypothetical protein
MKFFPCNHIINIKKKISFSGEAKDSGGMITSTKRIFIFKCGKQFIFEYCKILDVAFFCFILSTSLEARLR